MPENYLVISRHEDEPHIETYTKESLKRALDDGEFTGYTFSLPENVGGDLTEFPAKTAVIFGGEAVIPKPIQKVTEYEL